MKLSISSGVDFDHGSSIPRDAATVMVVRDSRRGELEVLMLRKTKKADFAGGAYVFPGGAVDDSDDSAQLRDYCNFKAIGSTASILGIQADGLKFWVAAVRECFEEAGILFATDVNGGQVSLQDIEIRKRFHLYRSEIELRQMSLIDLCESEKLRLSLDQIYYVSHWITPDGAPRRYDTRFFVARVPPQQLALNDGSETVEHQWITPAKAIANGESGEFQLIFPTISNLNTIGEFTNTDDLIAYFRGRGKNA